MLGFKNIFAFCFLLLLISTTSFGSTVDIISGDIFTGQEFMNDRPTGNTCRLEFIAVESFRERGLHCYKQKLVLDGFDTRLEVQGERLELVSRVTNSHRDEYPRLRSCAVNINGSVRGDEIYSDNTDILFNDAFIGGQRSRFSRVDYYLNMSSQSKRPTRLTITVTRLLSERSFECRFLQLK